MTIALQLASPSSYEELETRPNSNRTSSWTVSLEKAKSLSESSLQQPEYASAVLECANTQWKGAEQFILGAAASTSTLLMNAALMSGGKMLGFKPLESCDLWNKLLSDVKDAMKSDDVTRALKEGAVSDEKLEQFLRGFIVIGAPIWEELFFRGIIQDLLLKRCLGEAIEKISPQHAGWLETRVGTAFRIAVTSALFGAMHLTDPSAFEYQWQATAAVSSGIVLGIIKESRLGMLGCIGCHMAHNSVGVWEMYDC